MDSLPTLSKKAIMQISLGEVVKRPILQILKVELVEDDGNELILKLSDGEHVYSSYMLDPYSADVNPEHFKKHTIIRLDQYYIEYNYTNSRNEVYIQLLSLILPAEEIMKRIGRPKTVLGLSDSEESDSEEDQINAFRNVQFYKHCSFRWSIQSEKAPLTNNVLSRILAGEIIKKPIVQILSVKLVELYQVQELRLTVTDGKQWNRQFYCSIPLSRWHEEIKSLTVVQIDEYKANTVKGDCIISQMTGLNQANDIYFKLDLMPRRTTLSSGSIAKIMDDGDRMLKPIVQIVDCKTFKFINDNQTCIRLEIYDGHQRCRAYLSFELRQHIQQNMVSKSTIVRLDTYKKSTLSSTGSNMIIIMEMTLLNKGHTACFEWNIMEHAVPKLTDDFIERLIVDDKSDKPVIQILEVKTFYKADTHKSRIRLFFSDGNNVGFAWLPHHLSHLSAELYQLPVVQLDQYTLDKCNSGKLLLTILEMTGLRRNPVRKQYKQNYHQSIQIWLRRLQNYKPEI